MKRKPQPGMTDREIVRALWPEGLVVTVWKGGKLWKAKFRTPLEQFDIALQRHYIEPIQEQLRRAV